MTATVVAAPGLEDWHATGTFGSARSRASIDLRRLLAAPVYHGDPGALGQRDKAR